MRDPVVSLGRRREDHLASHRIADCLVTASGITLGVLDPWGGSTFRLPHPSIHPGGVRLATRIAFDASAIAATS